MVHMVCPVNCQTLIKSILLDGKYAREAAKDIGDKVQCIDEKVQVVIDGVRVFSSQWFKHSDSYTFR